MRRWVALAGACALAAVVGRDAAAQAVPGTVTFTARIADNGVPASGQHDLGFSLFSGATGGTSVWQEGPVAFTVVDGLIYHELGSSTSLDDLIFAGSKLYLELTVDGTTLSPRVAIVSVPYAIRAGVAGDAESLGGFMAGDFLTGVTAGAGLTGGGSTGDVTLGVTFGGSGTAATVSRSDHGHSGTYLPVGASLSCAPGDFVTSITTGGDLVCTTPTGGGDLTPDTIADDGLITLGSETFGSYDSTADTIADDGVITLGSETFGSYDSTGDTIADDGTITLGTETTGAYDATGDTIADDGTITLGTETTGAYDATGDTIGDDGVIDDIEASDNLSISNGRLFAPAGAGGVGVGTTTPNGPFQISATSNIANSCGGAPWRTGANALVFGTDPGGGCGDHAWINYQRRGVGGEGMTLELVAQNDPDDHIALLASGNVGVNTSTPSGAKFVVNANPNSTALNDGFEDGTLAPFTSAGSVWTVGTGVFFSGTQAARSAVIPNGASTTMSYVFVATEPSVVSFAQRVSSEGGWDFLRFYINGVEQLAWSGDSGWQQLSFMVPPGSHTLTWTYSKDPIITAGLDAAFVDDVLIQGYGNSNAIVAAGRVGIGTSTPQDMLQVTGDVRVGNGTTGCVRDADATIIAGACSSDARLKTHVTPFAPMLDRVAQLEPVEFDWRAKEFPERGFGERRSWGLIAQDVEKLFPDLVTEDAQGYKAVNYSKLPLLMLQALKEEHARNDRLESRLGELERKLTLATAPPRGRSPALPMALGAGGALALALAAFALRRRRPS